MCKVAQLFTFHKVEESSNRFVVMVKLPLPFICEINSEKILGKLLKLSKKLPTFCDMGYSDV